VQKPERRCLKPLTHSTELKSLKQSALYLRSVCLFNIVFRAVRCHPLILHLFDFTFVRGFDSFRAHHLFNDLPSRKPARKHFTEVLKKRELARMGSKRTAHLRHTSMG